MNRKEFDNLSIENQVKYVNAELSKDKTITYIAKEIGIGRSTINDRFKKIGHTYSKEKNQFIDTRKKVENNNTDDNEFDIRKEIADLKNLIKENKNNEKEVINVSKIPQKIREENVLVRSVKIYESIFRDFEDMLIENKGIKKQDMYSIAIWDFVEKYKK